MSRCTRLKCASAARTSLLGLILYILMKHIIFGVIHKQPLKACVCTRALLWAVGTHHHASGAFVLTIIDARTFVFIYICSDVRLLLYMRSLAILILRSLICLSSHKVIISLSYPETAFQYAVTGCLSCMN